ncbi:hypothetical protein ACWEOW_19810 [Monashia sp. NPDC004114]
MGSSVTRVTIIWFVGGAVVGVAAAGLHVLRTDVGGAHTGMAITVGAWAATILAALMLYRGIMVAASEQDEAARRQPRIDRGARIPDWSAYDPASRSTETAQDDVDLELVDEGDDAYTFRRGHRQP